MIGTLYSEPMLWAREPFATPLALVITVITKMTATMPHADFKSINTLTAAGNPVPPTAAAGHRLTGAHLSLLHLLTPLY